VHVVPVVLGPESYDITIGPGALAALPDVLARRCPAARYAIIADTTVAGLYGDPVRAAVAPVGPCDLFPFPAGEGNKTRDQWAALSDAMANAGIGRDGAVLALGGGVSGDLAGFVAATYRRGIPFVQVPTSLMAMLDSSIGGKTGVDTAHGKNLVGAFHQPRAVIADVTLLRTLPDPHVRAGLVEAVKHGAIADRGHFDRIGELRAALLAREPDALEEIISRSVAIKAEVVGDDARERGRRAVLNFGHTVGHAVEAASGYALLHGEAIAIGMAVEADLGTALGITRPGTADQLRSALEALDLTTGAGDLSSDAILDAMTHDKKSRGGTVRFAFLQELGQAARSDLAEWTFSAPENLIRAALTQ
jgi:3-dehydroquinate synthase